MTSKKKQALQTEKTLSIELTLEEINKIMTALGNLPYVQVYQIISKIQMQAGNQMTPELQPGHQGNGEDNKK